MTLILSRKDVMSVLDMQDCIEAVEKAFAELALGTAVLPQRIAISPPEGLSLYMPAYLKDSGILACKVVTIYKNNPLIYNLPTTIGKVLLQDTTTGDVLCIMDGGYLTAVRTGAASGVATRRLAREDKGQLVSLFGCGVQAKMQLWAVSCVRDIAKARIWDLSETAMDGFIHEMQPRLGIPLEKANAPDEMTDADIVITATSASTPLFDGKLLRAGTHINGIGSHTPGQRELDTETVARAKFIGDSREACFKEAGDLLIPISEGRIDENHYYASLGDIITGKIPGRQTREEITLFKSNGLAIQDAATAALVYRKAKEAGIGAEVEI